MPKSYPPTALTRTKRRHDRGRYDRKTVHAILDAHFVCHVGYVLDGQPVVTPTAYWREGEWIYWHGSAASRMLRRSKGAKVCLTVTHLDGLVIARSGFNKSVNYRSAMCFGTAEPVDEPGHKMAALKAFVERLYPGRWREIRPPTAQEMKATTVLRMKLREVSAKIRTGPPHDDEPDYALPIWAGILPLATVAGAPIGDPRLKKGLRPPAYLKRFQIG